MTLIAKKSADNYQLRLPEGLRAKVAERATANGRSMNTEIIAAIERHLERGGLRARVERIEQILGITNAQNHTDR